jgi:hypothetical protein
MIDPNEIIGRIFTTIGPYFKKELAHKSIPKRPQKASIGREEKVKGISRSKSKTYLRLESLDNSILGEDYGLSECMPRKK